MEFRHDFELSAGEGDEERAVPQAGLEVEVSSRSSNNDGHDSRAVLGQRPPLPRRRNPLRAPFRTAKGFGNWLLKHLDLRSFNIAHLKLIRYCGNYRIGNLIRFSKRLGDFDRLYFLEGLKIIAVSLEQKELLAHKVQEQQRKMQMQY